MPVSSVITIFMVIAIELVCTSSKQCHSELLNYIHDDYVMTLRESSPHFNCILKCKALFEPDTDRVSVKPKFREPVFTLKKNHTNCLQQQRNVATFYKPRVKGIQLWQIKYHPLIFIEQNKKKTYFGAQKFCRRHGLIFAPDHLVEDVFDNFTSSHVEIFWSSAVVVRNMTDPTHNWEVECTVYYKEEGKILNKAMNCKSKNNFFCALPEFAHSTRCEIDCLGDACKAVEEVKENCEPFCKKIDCAEELEDKYLYRASDGDLIEACGKRYLLSKIPNLNYKSAETFCCTRYMDLVSIETAVEMSCLAKEILKLGYNNTQYWTSGNSMPCANTFAWCAANEIIDKYNLPWSPPNSKDKNCVALRALNGTNGITSMAFDNEPFSQIKRAICEGETSSKCVDSKCYMAKCSVEYSFSKPFSRKTPAPRVTYLEGCNKTFSIGMFRKDTYHQSSKWCCAGNFSLFTIKDYETMKCLQELFKKTKVASNTFWIGASSIGCPSVLRWCDWRENPLVGNHLKWAPGEPSKDPLKECVYLDYSATTGAFLFFKDNCRSSKFFICNNSLD